MTGNVTLALAPSAPSVTGSASPTMTTFAEALEAPAPSAATVRAAAARVRMFMVRSSWRGVADATRASSIRHRLRGRPQRGAVGHPLTQLEAARPAQRRQALGEVAAIVVGRGRALRVLAVVGDAVLGGVARAGLALGVADAEQDAD